MSTACFAFIGTTSKKMKIDSEKRTFLELSIRSPAQKFFVYLFCGLRENVDADGPATLGRFHQEHSQDRAERQVIGETETRPPKWHTGVVDERGADDVKDAVRDEPDNHHPHR